MFYVLVIHSETKENERISPTIWIPKYYTYKLIAMIALPDMSHTF